MSFLFCLWFSEILDVGGLGREIELEEARGSSGKRLEEARASSRELEEPLLMRSVGRSFGFSYV